MRTYGIQEFARYDKELKILIKLFSLGKAFFKQE